LIPTNHKGSVPRGGLVYLKDKKVLIVGFEDGTLDFYNLKKKQIAFGLILEKGPYWGLGFNHHNNKLYAHSKSGVLKVWNFEGERPIQQDDILIDSEGDKPMGLVFLDKFVLSLSNSQQVMVIDSNDGKVLKKLEVPNLKCQTGLLITREQRILIADETSSKIGVIRYN